MWCRQRQSESSGWQLEPGRADADTWQHLCGAVGRLAFPCDAVITSQLPLEAGPTVKGLKELCAPCRSEATALGNPYSMHFGDHLP